MNSPVRVLGPGEEGPVEDFLGPHADSSLFLLGNLRAAGLADTGAAYSATWAGTFDGRSILGVAAHCWNGVLLLQAPLELVAALARAALSASGRPLAGLSGPRGQVERAREALGLGETPVALDHAAELFSLDLGVLAVPGSLARGEVACGTPATEDLPLLVDWRVAYAVETLGASPGEALRAACAEEVGRLAGEGNAFVLRAEGVPVAFSAFNARLPEVVQVGGVFTPPGLRGRGYARAVVAGSLLAVRRVGISRAVLFTERENEAARRAYRALGFRVTGDYGMILFETAVASFDRLRGRMTPEEETIRRILQPLARAPLPDDAEASLFDLGVLDSFGLVEAVGRLEEAFGVKVPDADLTPRRFETLSRIAAYFSPGAR